MPKKMEFYKDKPVFIASDSKQLKAAVAKYKGEVVPPYVVKGERLPDPLDDQPLCQEADPSLPWSRESQPLV